jgi:hypothetical protein
MSDSKFTERRVATGLIISTEYCAKILPIWNDEYIISKEINMLSSWAIQYFEQYGKAPGRQIEDIYVKESDRLKKAETELLEDLLEFLSDEYEREDKFNVQYLIDQTLLYFDERALQIHIENLQDSMDRGDVQGGVTDALSFRPSLAYNETDIDLHGDKIDDAIRNAFASSSSPLIQYPRQVGDFWNHELIRGGFISLMAPEKRGKTWMLLDLAMRAASQKTNVAFFQAGDMDQDQQLKRVAIRLAGKSDKEMYAGKMYEPIRDCIHNQLNTCDKPERETDFGIFESLDEDTIRKSITKADIIRKMQEDPEYSACYNCNEYWKKPWGAVYYKELDVGPPLTAPEAIKSFKKFFKGNRRMRLSTHPSRTLKVSDIERKLDDWERSDGFVPDVILIDYVDIMAAESKTEFRHQENEKWLRLRGLSTSRHALVVTATQADAKSYTSDTLSIANFSEDKRKFAHVTAMYGLNQDRHGREKELGIMRLNQLVVRESEFSVNNQVRILQNLRRGQACLSSFW